MLQNEYLVAKIGVDTAEDELSKVCRSKQAIPTPVINLALITPHVRRAIRFLNDMPKAVLKSKIHVDIRESRGHLASNTLRSRNDLLVLGPLGIALLECFGEVDLGIPVVEVPWVRHDNRLRP